MFGSRNKKKREGFTLLEVMVTVVLSMILTGTILVYNRSGESQVSVFKDEATVVGVINRAKAFTQQRLNTPLACGFGIHIDGGASKSFQLFADKRSQSWDSCVSPTGTYALGVNFRYDGSEEVMGTYELDSKSKFIDIPAGGLDVVFIPPDLTVTSSAPIPTTFKISDESGLSVASITIAPGGQVVTH